MVVSRVEAEVPDGGELSSEDARRVLQAVSTHRSALRRVESTVSALPLGVGPASLAQLALVDQKWREIEQTYGVLDATGYARLVGASPTTRSVATKARARGLLGYRRGHRVFYPGFQLTEHGLRPGWGEIVAPLREAGWEDEDIIL